MRTRAVANIALGLVITALIVRGTLPRTEPPVKPLSRPQEGAPLCPWREPEADLKAFFPGAKSWRTEIRILSGSRLDLARLLGRMPTAEENVIYLERVEKDGRSPGTIMVRRVKGEYGAIEIVEAMGADHRIRGVRIQRIREPAPVAGALRSPEWLRGFVGLSAIDAWDTPARIASLPPEAQVSGKAIAEGVRSLAVVFHVAEMQGVVHQH